VVQGEGDEAQIAGLLEQASARWYAPASSGRRGGGGRCLPRTRPCPPRGCSPAGGTPPGLAEVEEGPPDSPRPRSRRAVLQHQACAARRRPRGPTPAPRCSGRWPGEVTQVAERDRHVVEDRALDGRFGPRSAGAPGLLQQGQARARVPSSVSTSPSPSMQSASPARSPPPAGAPGLLQRSPGIREPVHLLQQHSWRVRVTRARTRRLPRATAPPPVHTVDGPVVARRLLGEGDGVCLRTERLASAGASDRGRDAAPRARWKRPPFALANRPHLECCVPGCATR
jgi:hypothetical protein